MTKINLNIEPARLTDLHLVTELHDLPRILELAKDRVNNGSEFTDIPEKFTLKEPGHIKYFYNKLAYLHLRYACLADECRIRGLKYEPATVSRIAADFAAFGAEHPELYKTDVCKDTPETVSRLVNLIWERNIVPKHYGNPVSKEYAVKLLLNNYGNQETH